MSDGNASSTGSTTSTSWPRAFSTPQRNLPTRRPRFAGRGGPSLVLPRSTATRSGRIVDAVRQRSAMHHKSVWRFAPRELAQWQANFCSHFLSYQRLRSASPVVVNNLCGELGRCQFCGPAPACSLRGWQARLPAHRLIGGYQADQSTANSSPLECIGELHGGGHVAGARPPHHCAARHRRDACSTAWRRKQTTRTT